MKNNYPELAKDFIDINIFLKYSKKFLKDLIENTNIEASIEIDKVGIGAGPIVALIGKTFILKIFSSSFGSSDRLGNCYLIMQPICPCMEAPYDLGHVVRYSLAYYANNPHFLISHLKRVKEENKLWKKIKPYRLSDKIKQHPVKYFDKVEESYLKLTKYLIEIESLPNSRLESYFNMIKALYLVGKKALILKKEIKCKDKVDYKNYDFIPYKYFKEFAKKREQRVIGKDIKYFYDPNLKKLFNQESLSMPIKIISMEKEKYKKYLSKLEESDFNLNSKLFKDSEKIFLLTSNIYI